MTARIFQGVGEQGGGESIRTSPNPLKEQGLVLEPPPSAERIHDYLLPKLRKIGWEGKLDTPQLQALTSSGVDKVGVLLRLDFPLSGSEVLIHRPPAGYFVHPREVGDIRPGDEELLPPLESWEVRRVSWRGWPGMSYQEAITTTTLGAEFEGPAGVPELPSEGQKELQASCRELPTAIHPEVIGMLREARDLIGGLLP